jgi:alginate O-acetyltransferase complex protein AlgJ
MVHRFGVSGIFMLIFLMTAATLSVAAVWQSRVDANPLKLTPVIKGEWTPLYEKLFNKNLFTYEASKNNWGLINYVAFHEGNEGVLIGQDNWLFTKEEFDHQPAQKEKILKNLDYIQSVHSYLDKKNIDLVVALVPSKARVYSDKLGRYEFPAYKKEIYSEFLEDLDSRKIKAVNLLTPMQVERNKESVFLKTDTHWTPEGARLTARTIAGYLSQESFSFDKTSYLTSMDKKEEHKGDLLRYIPTDDSFASKNLPVDTLPVFQTVEVNSEADAKDAAEQLFSEKSPAVTLVGTSYSANPKWNFAGFLKESMQTDILNAADEGLGPFETMDKYLDNEAFKKTPPELVIWEIPERYLSFEYDLKTDFLSEGV